MNWKKRMMTPPPDEDLSVEIIKEGGAATGKIEGNIHLIDQASDSATMRGWDELTIEEKCNRLGKWIGYIMNKMEPEI
ncbi:MAG: hypothetical protein JSV09_00390 [Thermoplasmata archaeon]|nr:MAG: hypothetical protein JSV09_00390 [Thermoplasmata archaeon]